MGAMLLGTFACSNYDDEISDLNGRIDNIEGSYVTVSSMESQIAAVSASIPDLTSIYSRLTSIEGQLGDLESSVASMEGDLAGLNVDLEDLQSTATSLEDAIATLNTTMDGLNQTIETSISTVVTEDFLTAMLDNVYLTEITLSDITSLLTSDVLVALLGDENEGIIKDIVDAMAEAANWVGNDELANYLLLEDAYTDEDAKAAAEEYFNSIKDTLLSATAGEDMVEDIELNAEAISKLADALEALESRIADLEGRIQSVVFVPETAGVFATTFTGKDYVTIEKELVYLTDATSTQELTFRVSPSSWASKLTTENVTLYSEEYTRSEAPFTIESIVASETEAGKFTVSLKYNLDEAALYGYGLALYINVDGADYTTSYVSVDVEAGADKTNSIVYGGYYSGEFATIASIDNVSVKESLSKSYDYTETVNFFDACAWYVVSADANGAPVYTSFASLYSNDSILSITEPKDAATLAVDTNKDSYTLTATSATIKSGATSALIGDVITSGDYTFALVNGETSIPFGTAFSELTITQQTHDFVSTAWSFNYEYGVTSYNSETFAIDTGIVIDQTVNAMSAEIFNALYGLIAYTDYPNDGRSLVIYESDKVTPAAISGYMYFESRVNSESDVKPLAIKLSNVTNVTADYVMVYTNTDVLGDIVTIEIPIHVEAIPAITAIPAINAEFEFEGQSSNELLASISAELWKVNSEALTSHMTEEQFTAMIANQTTVDNSSAAMSLSVASDVLSVSYDFSTLVFGEKYPMVVNFNDTTLGDDFTSIEATVTLNNSLAGSITAANAFVDGNGNVEIETVLTADSFTVADKDLVSTHNLISSNSLIDGVTMTYSIVEDLDAWKVANPTLSAPTCVNNKLVWNEWNSNEIKMVVEAELQGVVVDSKEFTAYIVNPLADAITTTALNLYIDDLTGTVDLNEAISLIQSKTNPSSNVFPTYQSAFGAAPVFEYVGTSDSTTSVLVELNGDIVSFDTAVATSSAVMQNAVSYTYKVTYETNYFGSYTAEISVKVNEAGVSAK